MAHGVVRTDKMAATDNRALLVSAKYMGSGSTATAVDNGNVLKLDGLVSNEREVYKAVTPAATSDLAEIVLVASPEIVYERNTVALDAFYNKAGEIARGYRLQVGDIFSVTSDAVSGTTSETAVGALVELAAAIKLNVAASATSGSTVIGKVIAIESVGAHKYFVIEVIEPYTAS